MPATRVLQRGPISVIDYRCDARPADEPFVELHDDFSVSYVRKGSFGCLADVGAGRVRPSLTDGQRFDLVLGISCHAVYHAGQVQLIKRLRSEGPV